MRKNSMLFFIDIDRFKQVNDTYGHEVDDLVLCKLASIFQQITLKDNRVRPLGGR